MKKKVIKKLAILLALASMTMSINACGSEEKETSNEPKKVVSSPSSVSDVLEEKTSASASTSSIPLPEEVDSSVVLSSIDGVDVDLTALSSTMVYSQVYNMMFYPENFIGKTIRMEGIYTEYFDQATGKRYLACFIMDATQCCSQGVEFELTSDYSYPDDYPTEGDTVVVQGVFDVYEEEGAEYCTLRNSKLIKG
ncbi:hypothetical protein SAMN02910275_02768 [Butyrivibrio sp. INlla18]|uniref:hypothetical protein n=1 Tax=Butyrivibrio sp. INlla18 TaxID=1520806 RepID=UPI000887A34F|nr:hypothetical protein [Butyrivibrio sp. INlla18]SDA77005.1 hypothetical protein SAMN02910275_02768 [Butyrivibrio sp. INlla18]